MNKKGISFMSLRERGLPIKVLMGLILLLTFFSGINSLFRGIVKTDLIASSSSLVTLIVNVLVGLSVLTIAVLSLKMFKRY